MTEHRPCGCCGETVQLAPLFTKNGYVIVRCRVCGLQYVNQLPAPAQLRAIYGEEFFHVGRKFSGDPASAGLINARHRVEAVRRLSGVGRRRWLDVGCATGDFLVCAASVVDEVSGSSSAGPSIAAQCKRGVLRRLPDGGGGSLFCAVFSL